MVNLVSRYWLAVLLTVLLGAAGFVFSTPQGHAQQIATSSEQTVRGLIVAKTRVQYRTELNAPVSKLSFREGMAFGEGDELIVFDCSRLEAEKRVTEANAKAADIETNTKRRLHKLRAAGKDEYLLAAANSKKFKAELEVHESRMRYCTFNAPFSGRIAEMNVKVHEFPPQNAPLVTLINDETLDLEMVVPSKWIVWMETGIPFEFKVDETGEMLEAKVSRMGAEVDPVSQTMKVYGELKSRSSKVLAGMSGSATFNWRGG